MEAVKNWCFQLSFSEKERKPNKQRNKKINKNKQTKWKIKHNKKHVSISTKQVYFGRNQTTRETKNKTNIQTIKNGCFITVHQVYGALLKDKR